MSYYRWTPPHIFLILPFAFSGIEGEATGGDDDNESKRSKRKVSLGEGKSPPHLLHACSTILGAERICRQRTAFRRYRVMTA
jgi:hypothetical protein